MVAPSSLLPRRGTRAAVVVGLVGAALTLAGGVLVRILSARPFIPVDESANVAYAVQVAHGHLPKAGPRIVTLFPHQRHLPQHTSNHPPLYHLLAGWILRAGLDSGHGLGSVQLARLLNLLFALLALLVVAALAATVAAGSRRRNGLVDPRRPAMLAVGAAGLLGALPHLVTAAGIVENDTLATLLVLATVLAFARIVVLGRSALRVIAMTLCGALASVTRVTSVPSVLVLCVALLVTGLIWPRTDRPAPLRRIGGALWPPLVVLAGTAASVGWFLVLNEQRYHDWSGGKAVEDLSHGREPGRKSIVSYLLNGGNWQLQFQQIVGGPDSRHGIFPDSTGPLAWVLLGLLGFGVLCLLIRLAGRWVRLPARNWLCVATLIVLLCASIGEIAVHAVAGGLPHGRYLLPAAGTLAVGAAAALLAYPLRLGTLAVAGVVGLEGFGTLRSLTVQLHRTYRDKQWWDALLTGMRAEHIDSAQTVLIVLLSAMGAGILMQFGALLTLARRARPAADPPVAPGVPARPTPDDPTVDPPPAGEPAAPPV